MTIYAIPRCRGNRPHKATAEDLRKWMDASARTSIRVFVKGFVLTNAL